MQTFLPYEDFQKSAEVLDYRRLGKQRVETWQIFKSLTEPGYGWKNHPAVKMWVGHQEWLLAYGCEICIEWKRRGYRDTLLQRFATELSTAAHDPYPSWLGNVAVHSSHRANLIRKDPLFYGSFGWTESAAEGYHWPTK